MICNYGYFKDKGSHVLNVKSVDYCCVLCNMTKNDAIHMLNSSKLDGKITL